MKELIEFLNNNEGAFMVIITFIYVAATIAICIANFKSAKASKEQLEEQKIQYEETKRLSLMPLLQLYEAESTDSANNIGFPLYFGETSPYNTTKFISLKNVGLGSAKNIVYECYNQKKDWIERKKPLKSPALISGQHVNIQLSYRNDTYHIFFYYQDLLGNHYKQIIDLNANSSIKITNHEIERDDT